MWFRPEFLEKMSHRIGTKNVAVTFTVSKQFFYKQDPNIKAISNCKYMNKFLKNLPNSKSKNIKPIKLLSGNKKPNTCSLRWYKFPSLLVMMNEWNGIPFKIHNSGVHFLHRLHCIAIQPFCKWKIVEGKLLKLKH